MWSVSCVRKFQRINELLSLVLESKVCIDLSCLHWEFMQSMLMVSLASFLIDWLPSFIYNCRRSSKLTLNFSLWDQLEFITFIWFMLIPMLNNSPFLSLFHFLDVFFYKVYHNFIIFHTISKRLNNTAVHQIC